MTLLYPFGYGAVQCHGALMPIVYQTVNLSTQRSITTTTTVATYMGRLSETRTSFSIFAVVLTAAATITWAEFAIAKGTPVLNAGTTLTPVGYASVSSVVNSTGFKVVTVTVTAGQSIGAGDHIWMLCGNQATTAMSLQCSSLDNEWTGLTLNATMRPSTNIGTGVAFSNESAKCPYIIVL